MNIPSECRTASIGTNHAMILHRNANPNPDGIFGKDSVENVLWGAPRIHGELLKLGFAVAQSTVAKYMAGKADPSGQRWSTFLRNHSSQIAAMDLFVVPTIGFNLLYVLVIVRLARRELVWLNVTAHPTAEWIAQQITEAFPWTEAPRYLIRDRDAIYGAAVTPITSHGHPRQAHRRWFAVAELICREADRIDPSRMRRPCHRIRRAAAPTPKILRELLQQRANTPFIGQRFAGLAPGSADRTHRVACPGRRASSPVRPNLAFQYTQV
jgi:hypothetical protein